MKIRTREFVRNLLVIACAVGATAVRAQQLGRPADSGQVERGPTRVGDPVPIFNMDYFVGSWAFDGLLPDSPLGTGGPLTGVEVVKKTRDARFYDVAIEGRSPDGPFTGRGNLTYMETSAGRFVARSEVTRGIAMFRVGPVGGDLGGRFTHSWETPTFEHGGAMIRLRGQTFLASPSRYRVKTEIAINSGPFQNFGMIMYEKRQ